MALHDTDKSTTKRGSPHPNADDRRSQRMANNTVSTSYQQDGNTRYQRVAMKNSAILWYDDQNRIIKVEAFIPSLANFPVTIVAKYGYDVYVDILGIDAPKT